MCLWARRRKRIVIGVERLALQGMSVTDIHVANRYTTSSGKMQKLAGDMFNLVSYGIVLDAVLACVRMPLGQ